MILETASDDGTSLRIECPDTIESVWTCQSILAGTTYPDIPFVGEVTTIVDVGANIGAATVYLAHHHPGVRVHAVEPGAEARSFLERNVVGLPQVTVHPVALGSSDATMELYHSTGGIGEASLVDDGAAIGSEVVTVRDTGAWAREHGIDRIDILKVDVEGYEVAVLEGLGELATAAKVIYVEYDDRDARRRIEGLFAPTHELYAGVVFLDQGECTYVRADLVADAGPARAHLRTLLRRWLDQRAQ